MTEQPIRVVQITDCHLLADPATPLHGWYNWQALNAVLQHARATCPRIDVLLLTGDLMHDQSAVGYRRLAAAVQCVGATTVCALPGNHDDPQVMREHMPGAITTGRLALGKWQLHLLDSHVKGSDGGRLGAQALAKLDQQLSDHPHSPTLIAVHHPVLPVGAAWLDAMRLHDGDALLRRLQQHPAPSAVACGHVHQADDQSHAGIRLLCSPAVTRQFRPASQVFAQDPRRFPGYRWLCLHPDGRLVSRVQRVPAAARANCG